MKLTSKPFSNLDQETLRRRALAKIYSLLIELADNSEMDVSVSIVNISAEQKFEAKISSIELQTEQILEVEPASILKPAS